MLPERARRAGLPRQHDRRRAAIAHREQESSTTIQEPRAKDLDRGHLALAAERRRRTIAEALRVATVRLTRSLHRETVLATLLECLRELVPFDRAAVMLVEEEGARLSVRVVFDGERVSALPLGARPTIDPSDHPALREVLANSAAVVLPGPGAAGTPAAVAAPEGSWLGVPLFVRGVVAGVFTLSRNEPTPFDEEHARVAEALASQASVAVDNAVLFEQMEQSKARLQTLSRRLVEAQERERRHIARELHDEAGQALAALRFGLRLLEREVGGGSTVTARVAELLRTTDAVIEGLHRLAGDLRPASLDHVGLDAALRQYALSTAATYGLEVRFKARGFGAERLPSAVETAIFRIVQEAVTNVVKHARAKRVDVLLEHRGDRVLAMVEDDGAGFDPEAAQDSQRFGLLGVRERAEALGGTLLVESAPGAGTTLVVEVDTADPHPDR
jgi:signal transduction histidine kinase